MGQIWNLCRTNSINNRLNLIKLGMYNWSVDVAELKKHSQKYKVWKLEQLINYGLGKQRISKKELMKYMGKLSIDGEKRRYLEFLLKS